MTLKRIIYCTGLVLFLLVDTSCKKWLDLQPVDGITRQEFWTTKEDLSAAVAGCYASLVGSPPGVSDRPIPLSIFLWGELRADMVAPTDASTTIEQKDIKEIVNVNILPSNSLITWSAFYRTINYCNTVIEFAPRVKASDPTLSDAEYNAYLGEVLTLRSLMYFYLVRTFRDVPLKLKATSKDSDTEEIGKSDSEVVLQQIVSDLKIAEAGLPEFYGINSQRNKGRVTKLAANALLADVYLWMENYSASIAECNKVLAYAALNPSQLRILNATSGWYTTVFELGSSPETIFEFSQTINNPFGNFLFSSSRRLIAATAVSTPIFEPDPLDVDNLNPDVRSDAFFSRDNGTIFKLATENTSFINFQIYRLSDVLLIKAEALALTDQGADALKIIDDLRLARRAVITTKQFPDPTDGKSVAEYVLAERAREFAFEGKRWFDLLRFAKRNNYEDISLLLSVVSTTVVPAAQQSAMAKFRDVDSHYLPINELDIFADTKLVQNPFYER